MLTFSRTAMFSLDTTSLVLKFNLLPILITEKVSFLTLRAKRATVTFLVDKSSKCSIWRVFKKREASGQTVLPDRSILKGQKLVENAKNVIGC